MFQPRGLPAFRVLGGEARVDFFCVFYGEVVGEAIRGAVEGDAAFVEDEDGIVEFEVSEGVGNGEDDAAVFA